MFWVVLAVLIIIIAVLVGVNFSVFSRKVKDPRKYYIAPSPIQGVGVFASRDFQAGEFIEVGIDAVLGRITKGFGNLINHSWTPNAQVIWNPTTWTYDCVAKTTIPAQTEITIDYHETPWFIKKPDPNWK